MFKDKTRKERCDERLHGSFYKKKCYQLNILTSDCGLSIYPKRTLDIIKRVKIKLKMILFIAISIIDELV